jgi:hypothetical protein
MTQEITIKIQDEVCWKMQFTRGKMSEHDYIKKIVESGIERDYLEFQRVAKMRQDAIRMIRLAEQISKEERRKKGDEKDNS